MKSKTNKKLKRNIVTLAIFILFMISLFLPQVYAETIDQTFEGADNFVDKGSSYNIDTSQLKSSSRFIYNALLAIGMVAAVIVGVILGIKYMISSSEDKAEVKETLIPYIISCCVIFGAFTIWKLVVNVLK